MRMFFWLAPAATALVLTPTWAHANSTTTTTVLPSMEDTVVADQQDPHNLTQISNRVNLRVGASEDDGFKVSDIIQTPILDGLLDEDGQVTLPLGIRVYDTMGDISVGFGSDF